MKTEPPKILYHYTTARAFLSIVGTKTIWATNVKFLNDTSELRHAIERAAQLWDESSGKYHDEYRAICDNALSIGMEYTYVASLSQRKDDLSQWRAYARPGGVCIGFSRKALEHIFRDNKDGVSGLGCCYYDDQELESLLLGQRNQIDANFDGFGVTRERTIEECFDLIDLASCSKNPKFASEEEVRLVFQPSPDLKPQLSFHERNGVVVPHYEMALENVKEEPWLKEVVVGPTPDPAAAVWAIEKVVERHNLDVQVMSSEIPYRDW